MNKFSLKLDSQNSISLNPKKKRKAKNESPMEEKFFESVKKNSFELNLKRQYPVDKYSLDFAYIDNGIKVAIEIDGLKWHSTKKQRQHDYQRERFLILNDWIVVRFTGSEIFNHSVKCVRELITIIKHYESNQSK